MTNQEAFDKVWHHMIKQGKPATSNGGECRYRGPDGTSCAIGCLIKDEDHSVFMEGRGVTELIRCSLLPDYLCGVNYEVLDRLQLCHDLSANKDCFLDEFKEEATKVAKDFNLKVPTNIGENKSP